MSGLEPEVAPDLSSPMPFLSQVGCSDGNGDRAIEHSITFTNTAGERGVADCSGVNDSITTRVMRQYSRAVSESRRGTPGLQSGPDDVYVTVYIRCTLETTKDYYPNIDEWIVTKQEITDCRTWRIYHTEPSPGGGWGGSGTEPTEVPPPPPPTDSLTTEGLNLMEGILCAQLPVQCGKYMLWSGTAWSWARSRALQDGQGWVDNKYDAWRHAAWSAMLTLSLQDATDAERWTEAREWNSRYPASTCMDRHNNLIGRQLALDLGSSATWDQVKYAVVNHPGLQFTPGCSDYN